MGGVRGDIVGVLVERSSLDVAPELYVVRSPMTLVTLLQLALSRSREYDADLEAAAMTGDPSGWPPLSPDWNVRKGGSGSERW